MYTAKKNILKKLLQRRNFAGLMDLYDRNYHLLLRLVPDLLHMPAHSISRAEEGPELHLKIVERNPYTTVILLTYYLPVSDGEETAEPDLLIRLYHDAGLAEATACRMDGFMPVHHSADNRRPYLDCRWKSNIFVEKWLQYSLQQGHCFSRQRLEQGLIRVPETRELAEEDTF